MTHQQKQQHTSTSVSIVSQARIVGIQAAGSSVDGDGVLVAEYDKVADLVHHVGALLGHQHTQESNLLRAAVAALKAWHWHESGRWQQRRAKHGLLQRQSDARAGGGVEDRATEEGGSRGGPSGEERTPSIASA